MYYFKKVNNYLEKYEVSFDKKQLLELKNIIIKECSKYEHEDYESDYDPFLHKKKNEIIINFKRVSTGKIQEYFEKDKTIYHYTYDRMILPYLVQLIENIINGNEESLYDIYTINYDKEIESPDKIEEQILKLDKEIIEIPNTNIHEKRKKLNELEHLLIQAKLNKTQSSIIPYYKKVQELINLKLVDTISIAEIDRINSFFSTSNEKDLTIDIKKLNLNKQ